MLLVLLLALLVAAAFVRTSYLAAAVVTVLVVASVLVTFRASGVRLNVGLVSLAIATGVAVFALAVTTPESSPVRAASLVVVALALAVGPPLILRRIFRQPTVTIQDIFAALCVYLQTGLSFAFVYAAVDLAAPDQFLAPGVSERATDYIYFSFVTMLTLGYGDLVPATDLGRMMVIIQALIGQILLVVLVAYLVGAMVNAAGSDSE